MLYLSLLVLSIPVAAVLWSVIGFVRDRRRLTRHHAFSLLGAFLLAPLVVCYLGVVENSPAWLASFQGVAFGTIGLVGVAMFARAEALNHRRRRIPAWACPQCGYDRRAGPAGPCPECGSAAQPAKSA